MTVISGFMTLMLSYIRDFLLPVQVPTNNNKTFMLTLGYILNRFKFYLIAFPTSTSILLSSYYLFCRMYRTRNFIELKCEVARGTNASLSLRNNICQGLWGVEWNKNLWLAKMLIYKCFPFPLKFKLLIPYV